MIESTNKPILIVSSSSDEHAYGPVANILEHKQHPVIIYKTDKVLSGDERFLAKVKNTGEFEMNYEEFQLSDNTIGSAWYRKPANFKIQSIVNDLSKQLYMNNEIRAVHDMV